MDIGTLNSIGLCLNIAGVAVAFFYGYPQPDHDGSVSMAVEDGTDIGNGQTALEYAAATEKRRKRYAFLSRTGLALMFAGFVLQLIATQMTQPT